MIFLIPFNETQNQSWLRCLAGKQLKIAKRVINISLDQCKKVSREVDRCLLKTDCFAVRNETTRFDSQLIKYNISKEHEKYRISLGHLSGERILLMSADAKIISNFISRCGARRFCSFLHNEQSSFNKSLT